MKVRLIEGDALVAMRGLKDVRGDVDVVMADPPYSSGTRKEGQKGVRKTMRRGVDDAEWFDGDALTVQGFLWFMRECALQWNALLRPGGHVFCFVDWRMNAHLSAAIESADLRGAGLIVWDKTYYGMGSQFRNQHEFILHFTKGVAGEPRRHDVGNVIACRPVRHGTHPTQKPVDLLATLISVVAGEGSLVLDPFAGVGSTGVAAFREGADSILIERNPYYVEDARQRLAPLVEDLTVIGQSPLPVRRRRARVQPEMIEAAE